jgi:hypothetical protein
MVLFADSGRFPDEWYFDALQPVAAEDLEF